jgi:hypothetical protein
MGGPYLQAKRLGSRNGTVVNEKGVRKYALNEGIQLEQDTFCVPASQQG